MSHLLEERSSELVGMRVSATKPLRPSHEQYCSRKLILTGTRSVV
jgi:hypothetical protein